MKQTLPSSQSPLSLAEFALEAGWPADEVTSTLTTITGPPVTLSEPFPHSATLVTASKVVHDEFARVAAKKR